MPVEPGSVTHCTAHAATAASKALPPAFSISMPASVELGCEVETMAFIARAAERVGWCISRMG